MASLRPTNGDLEGTHVPPGWEGVMLMYSRLSIHSSWRKEGNGVLCRHGNTPSGEECHWRTDEAGDRVACIVYIRPIRLQSTNMTPFTTVESSHRITHVIACTGESFDELLRLGVLQSLEVLVTSLPVHLQLSSTLLQFRLPLNGQRQVLLVPEHKPKAQQLYTTCHWLT